MLSRLFLRRYSVRSRTRSLPLRGDVNNAPGNVSSPPRVPSCGVLYLELTTNLYKYLCLHTQTEYAFPDKEQGTAILGSSRRSFVRILSTFHCHFVPAEEEGDIAVCLLCHL